MAYSRWLRPTVRGKVLGLALLMVVILSSVVAHSLYRLREINEELTAVAEVYVPLDDRFADLALLSAERDLVAHFAETLRDAPLSRRAAVIDKLIREDALIEAWVADIRSLLNAPAGEVAGPSVREVVGVVSKSVDVLEARAEAYRKETFEFRKLLEDGKTPTHFHEILDSHGEPFDEAVRDAIEALMAFTEASAREAEHHEFATLLFNLAMASAALVLGIVLALMISAGIVRPVRSLAAGASRVQAGSLEVSVAKSSQDEVGDLTVAFNDMIKGLRLKERIKDAFGKYVDPRIVDALLTDEGFLSRTERREMTVSFVDLKGFTAMSERLSPENLVAFLNAFLTAMSDAVSAHNGVVDKFVGDAVMAFFGPPFVAAEGHGAEACLVALDQVRRMEELQRAFPHIGALDIKIGISSGELVVGNIGSDSLRTHTVVGDTVNLAARLETLNKVYGTRILVSERTRDLAGDAIEVREIDRVTVRGKSRPTRVYEVLAPADGMSEDLANLRDRFETGLAAFRKGDTGAAVRAFEACLAIDPQDSPSRIYLERCR